MTDSKNASIIEALSGPGVEVVPLSDQTVPLKESRAFRPVRNGRRAHLDEAKKYEAQVTEANRPLHRKIIEKMGAKP